MLVINLKIRLGYVAMSMNLENCSPSRTATVSVLEKLDDTKNKITKLKHIAKENLQNTLRILTILESLFTHIA